MRDKIWLINKLEQIWNTYFPDLEKKNEIRIMFKGKSKNTFGNIKLTKDKASLIRINELFTDERIPEWIIELTIAHELVHYSHGFFSSHSKKFKHPHQGNIVKKELISRGFNLKQHNENKWFKEFWIKNFEEIKKDYLIQNPP